MVGASPIKIHPLQDIEPETAGGGGGGEWPFAPGWT